jgi:hypothetical protein
MPPFVTPPPPATAPAAPPLFELPALLVAPLAPLVPVETPGVGLPWSVVAEHAMQATSKTLIDKSKKVLMQCTGDPVARRSGRAARWPRFPVHSRRLLGIALIIIVIAQEAGDSTSVAFDRAARGALGRDANLKIFDAAADPPDDESVARGNDADGVVELTWSADRSRARVHCYFTRQRRWVDREISFAGSGDDAEREFAERGRLLGFAVATMFADGSEQLIPAAVAAPTKKSDATPGASAKPATTDARPGPEHGSPRTHSLEFAGIVSSGLHGTASGLGAAAALRLGWTGPLSVRGFVAGRAGNIPRAQASTRTLQAGGGVSAGWLPASSPWDAGVRLDLLLSYFEASHLSEDDAVPDRRSRWLPGGDLLAEAGFRFADYAGLYAGAGVEVTFGSTEIYTHGQQVAVIPALRAVGELGFRTHF